MELLSPIEKMEKFKKEAEHIPNFTIHTPPSWKEGKIDFVANHPLATKQYAVLEVARLLGITPGEIIGVGDGENDVRLLMACGLKVAVGNADEDVKAIADYIAPSVENDAIADIIEKFVIS